MKSLPYLLALLVAALNICLHYLASKAAGEFSERITSPNFLLAFVFGTLSLLGIYAFYTYLAGANLARGIISMGAASIIGGTLIGVFIQGKEIDQIEKIVFGLILAMYAWKFFRQV